MRSKALRFGPQFLANAVANILQPGSLTGGYIVVNGVGSTFGGTPYTDLVIVLTHIRIVNTDNADHNFQLYIVGTSGTAVGGQEFMGYQQVVPANDYIDWYGSLPLYSIDYLTGLADAASVLTIEGEGEIGVA